MTAVLDKLAPVAKAVVAAVAVALTNLVRDNEDLIALEAWSIARALVEMVVAALAVYAIPNKEVAPE